MFIPLENVHINVTEMGSNTSGCYVMKMGSINGL